MRCWAFVIPCILFIPAAAAADVGTGPVEAKVVFERMTECTIGLNEEVCVASWDAGGDPGVGDDDVNTTRIVRRASASIRLPGAASREIVIDPQEAVVEHPANAILKEAWLAANDSRPEAVASYVQFEAGPRMLTLALRFPVPLPSPFSDGYWERSYAPVYVWDCSVLFTNYSNWDKACSYDGARPLPNGVRNTETTDGFVTLPEELLQCEDYDGFAPQTCPALEAGAETSRAAAAAWTNATPSANVGAGVEEVAVRINSSHERDAGGIGGSLAHPTRPSKSDLSLYQRMPVGAAALKEAQEFAPLGVREVSLPPRPSTGPPTRPEGASVQSEGGRPALLLGAAAVAATAFLTLLAVGLYHRLTRSRALENENRQRILNAVRRAPGIRAGTIAMELGLNHATVAEHLRVLERFDLVDGEGDGQRRYFLTGTMSLDDKRVALAASSPIARALLDHLAKHERAEFADLCEALRLGRSTASMTVSRLEEQGIVRKWRERGRVWIEVVTPQRRDAKVQRGAA